MQTKRSENTMGSKPPEESLSADVINPYFHQLELTTLDKIKVLVMTFTLMPIRILLMLFFLCLAWAFAKLGLSGLSEEQLYRRPLEGWRKTYLKRFIIFLLRLMFVVGGWHWVKIKGKKASPREAPILTVAPHSSIFDVLPVILLGAPSVVAKAESEDTTLFGTLINYTQPVYVCRNDPQSRQNTIQKIMERTQHKDDMLWDQILIFPEGTCTNRSCLISFKSGAFYPKVPVQPVCIKYPNRLDTMSWTWQGPGALKLLWLSLCQLHNYCEIEYLPVYVPSEEEKNDSRLYAKNVREAMAKALQVPVSHYAYDDLNHIRWIEKHGLPRNPALIKLAKLHHRVRKSHEGPEIPNSDYIQSFYNRLNLESPMLNLQEFQTFLGATEPWESLRDFFEIMDLDKSGRIDARAYIAGLELFNMEQDLPARIKEVVLIFSDQAGILRKSDFRTLSWVVLTQPSSGQLPKMEEGCITKDKAEVALLSCCSLPQQQNSLTQQQQQRSKQD